MGHIVGNVVSRASAGGGGDPSFSSVVFLSHFDGADGSTTITDVKGHTITANGNAQLDTAQQKFGTASLLLDGTGDYTSTPDSADWILTGDFTIEGWVRFAALTGNHVFASQYNNVGNQRAWFLRRTTGDLLTFSFFTSAGTATNGTAHTLEGAWTPVIDTWYHIAVTRSGTTYRLFADGVVVDTDTDASAPTNSDQPLIFGAINSSGLTQFLNGWLDEWRITNGVARYTGAFTPPAAAFPDS